MVRLRKNGIMTKYKIPRFLGAGGFFRSDGPAVELRRGPEVHEVIGTLPDGEIGGHGAGDDLDGLPAEAPLGRGHTLGKLGHGHVFPLLGHGTAGHPALAVRGELGHGHIRGPVAGDGLLNGAVGHHGIGGLGRDLHIAAALAGEFGPLDGLDGPDQAAEPRRALNWVSPDQRV